MPRHFRLTVLPALGAVLLCALPGCNRGDDVTPPIVIQTPQPQRVVVVTSAWDGFETGFWYQVPVDIQAYEPGILDITVDWTKDETWMFVYFGDTQCGNAALTGGTCPFLIASEMKDPKPRVLYTDLLEPGIYYLYLYNVPRVPGTDIGSDIREAVSVVLGLTVGFQLDAREGEPLRIGQPLVLSPPRL
jgi:hypothetical protein